MTGSDSTARRCPIPVDWERVRVEDPDPRYVTFVNPTLYKGAYPFVRIAQELGRRRPDIPLLVVESRATKATLGDVRAQAHGSSQYPDHAGHHRSAAVLAFDQDSVDAVALVGESRAGRGRGHDQWHPGHRLRPRRHTRDAGRWRRALAVARAAHAGEQDLPWELIAIDNRSTDHTDVYLAGVRDAASVPVGIISNSTNLGFPGAINQGLKAARGEYLVFLNNDLVVTDGWLEQLIGLVKDSRCPQVRRIKFE